LPTPPSATCWPRSRRRSWFFALEIASAIVRGGDPHASTEELPIPASLQELVRDRLALLAPAAREAVQAVAALSRPTVTVIDRVMGGRREIEAAVAAGVVELDGDQVRVAHPLLASVILAQMSPARKRELHAGLAAAVIGRRLPSRCKHPAPHGTNGARHASATQLPDPTSPAAARRAPTPCGLAADRARGASAARLAGGAATALSARR